MNVLRSSRAWFVIALLMPVLALLAAVPAAAQQDFYTVNLCRAYDSRGAGGPLDPGTIYNVTLEGVCNVPADATGVAVNVTIISPEAGDLVIFPAGGAPPAGSPPVNGMIFRSGRTQAKNYQVGLGTGGAVSFRASTAPGNPDIFHLIIDVTGYYKVAPPEAVDDSYAAEKDTTLNVPAATGVTSNDTLLSGATIVTYGASTGAEQTTLGVATPTSQGGSIVLNANGSFSYTPPAGAVGIDDTFKYILQNAGGTSTATVTIGVGKASQTINFTSTAPSDATVGGPTYAVTATATSGLPVAFTIDAAAASVCSISGSTVSFIGVGTCVINANQAGDTDYSAAPQVQQTFAVGKGDQTISFTSTAPSDAEVGGVSYNVTATATSGLPVAFTIDASASTVCSISGSTVTFTGVGTCVVNANQAGDASYNAAPQVQQSFAVGTGAQTITFTSTAPSDAVVNGPTYDVTATASSGLPVTFTIDASAASVCSISGSTVSFTAAGTCVINANQPGDASYDPAPQAQQSFAVGLDSQTINFTSTAPAGATVGGSTYEVTATATSGLTVTFSVDASATSVCSVAGSTVSFIGVGTCVINADQAGDAIYSAAPQVQQSFAVAQGDQTITFSSTVPVNAQVGGATYNVMATASSGLLVALTIDASASSVCSISGSTVSFIGAGTCVINANQAGNANYNAAPQVQQSFAVAKGDQTLSFTSTAPVNAQVGGATYNVTATATSGLTVALTIDASASTVCSISGSTVSFIGAGTCVINANQAGDVNYNAASQVQQSFAVAKGDQTIAFTSTAPADAKVGGPTYNVTATASSGLPVTLTIDASAASVCSISGSTVSFIGSGICTINANQAGNANYNAAPQVQQSFQVYQSPQITSANSVNFTSTVPGTFTVTTTGFPTGAAMVITETGALPSGVTFTNNNNGTATLAGTPAAGTQGTYNLTINANNGIAPAAAQSFTLNVLNNVPQLATNPVSYTTPGNTQLHVAGATLPGLTAKTDATGLLSKSGATDPDGPAALTVVPAAGVTANGGNYSISADGRFTYVPAAGFSGTDSFNFQVTDSLDTATGQISVAVGTRVWYIRDVVDANNAAGGDGRSTNAFESIAAFNAATTFDNDIIFVFEGNTGTTPHTGSITLKNGQKLHGQPTGLTVPGHGTLISAAGNRPRIRTTAVSTDVISVPATAGSRSNVEILGLDLEATGATSNAIDVTASGGNAVGITISNNNVRGATAEGIDLNSGGTATFTVTLQDNAIVSANNGIDTRVSSTGIATVTASNIMITSTAGNAFDARTLVGASALRVGLDNANVAAAGTGIFIDGSAAGTTTITSFGNNVVNGNSAGTGISVTSAIFDGVPGSPFNTIAAGITLVGASGAGNGVGGPGMVLTNVQGDLSFTDLDIFADGGAGLRVSSTTAYTGSAGLRMVVGAGVGMVEATGGPAVDISQAAITLPLSSIRSTNSLTTGLALNSVTGSFSAGDTSNISNIASAAGTAFQVGGSNAAITYEGAITTNQGTGVSLTSNAGSTINFSGALMLSTGSNPAFVATGGGTVTATNTSSTLTSTTGTALNVANTTIGAGGLRFRSVSAGTAASGPTNGIVLNNTGSSGGLAVSGSGTAGSGGTIQRAATGISLTNTRDVSLAYMQLNDHTDFGIRGASVVNFSMANTVINGTNGNDAGADEGSVRFTELTGSATISSSTISGAAEDNVAVVNTTGTLNRFTLSSTTIGANSTTTGGDGLFVETQGSAVINATVQNSFFTSSRGDLAQFTQGSTGSMDVVIQGTAFSDNHPAIVSGGGGVVVGGTNGSMTFNVSNNTFRDATGTAFAVSCGNAGQSCVGRIENNQVGLAGTANSGSTGGSGIAVVNSGGGTVTALVNNNQVRQYNNHGILLQAGQTLGNATNFNVTVTNNTVSNPGSLNTNFNGIHLNNGTVPGENHTSCVDIRSNSIAGAGAGAVAPNNADYRLRQRQSTTVRLPGYGGANNNDAGVVAFVSGLQTSVTTGASSNTVGSGGGGFVGGAACAQP